MHSLKNTIIAVGLLGLSFLFYQASSHKSPVADEMVPALDISDGFDNVEQPATLSVDAIKPQTGSMENKVSGVEVPSFIKPGQAASDFSDDSTVESEPRTGRPASRQPFDSVARDEGLIDALNTQQQTTSQNQFSATPPPKNNSFVTEADNSNGPESEFSSQPIPSADSSYNAVATDNSNSFGSEVARADSEPDLANLSMQAAWPQVDKLIAQNEYRDALQLLSRYYRSTDLTGPQRQRLTGWLDALAAKVIFSAEHHLEEMPYTVATESLVDIGTRWKVPAQLIYNINQNQISNPLAVAKGTQIKVVQGPFDAEIDTRQNVMTLFLGDLYAGRFPVRLGVSGNPEPGEFSVMVKSELGHSWRDSQGNSYPAGAPENGYGPHWIGLSGSLCIHAVDDDATDGHHGCIGLSQKDAKDVFAILADGSSVKILR